MRAALIQLSVTDDPVENLAVTRELVREAAAGGAGFVLTPEVTNCLSSDRAHQIRVLTHEEEDQTLARLREEAEKAGIWLLIGSLGIKTHDVDGRFASRSFLIGTDGGIAARYDKIHMFDVNVSETEQYRESAGYRPGTRAVLAVSPWGEVLADGGAEVGISYVDLTMAEVAKARARVPSLIHDRPFDGP